MQWYEDDVCLKEAIAFWSVYVCVWCGPSRMSTAPVLFNKYNSRALSTLYGWLNIAEGERREYSVQHSHTHKLLAHYNCKLALSYFVCMSVLYICSSYKRDAEDVTWKGKFAFFICSKWIYGRMFHKRLYIIAYTKRSFDFDIFQWWRNEVWAAARRPPALGWLWWILIAPRTAAQSFILKSMSSVWHRIYWAVRNVYNTYRCGAGSKKLMGNSVALYTFDGRN